MTNDPKNIHSLGCFREWNDFPDCQAKNTTDCPKSVQNLGFPVQIEAVMYQTCKQVSTRCVFHASSQACFGNERESLSRVLPGTSGAGNGFMGRLFLSASIMLCVKLLALRTPRQGVQYWHNRADCVRNLTPQKLQVSFALRQSLARKTLVFDTSWHLGRLIEHRNHSRYEAVNWYISFCLVIAGIALERKRSR
jgi:hypothetical protein